MTFRSVKEIVDAEESGAVNVFSWRKTPTASPTASTWFDLSMSPGNPKPNYYASSPLVAQRMAQSTDGGLVHGGSVSPAKKYLSEFLMFNNTSTFVSVSMLLCDYLLYYPFCDDSETAPQSMDNTITLSRYTNGEGVRIMPVSVASRSGYASFTVNYTNSLGVSGRTTRVAVQSPSVPNGSIIAMGFANPNASVPFLTLQNGDTGVRSIESVQMIGGDVGLFTLVLVKPLATLGLNEQTAPAEKNFITMNGCMMPEIQDDAYLNLITITAGVLNTGSFFGTIKTIWK